MKESTKGFLTLVALLAIVFSFVAVMRMMPAKVQKQNKIKADSTQVDSTKIDSI